MNFEHVELIANAVLYEGYILYPYRASAVKNRQRFTFGGLYPPAYCQGQTGSDTSLMRTECLVLASDNSTLHLRLRFLHPVARQVYQLSPETNRFEPVESLNVRGQSCRTWQEAIERTVSDIQSISIGCAGSTFSQSFTFPANRERETLCDADGEVIGMIERSQECIDGTIEISTEAVQPGLIRLSIVVENATCLSDATIASRSAALRHGMASTHVLLGVDGGEFVSLLEPPESLEPAARQCRNQGTWPVMVGDESLRNQMLSSPIILYDFPQIASESAGDLFDGTEIDEILTLRIMTLTEEEKRDMRAVDVRARALLERTESLTRDQLMKMHGAMREVPGHSGTQLPFLEEII